MKTKVKELEAKKLAALRNYEAHCAATLSAIAELNYCREEQAKAFDLLMSSRHELDSGISKERAQFYWNNPEAMPDSVGA
jgi:hypothetical protein